MKRILTIDGGGIKGVFPAAFLATIEDTIGNDVADHFDLIVGTSTGGIIALGLGLGFSASEILQFYKQLGPGIFGGGTLSNLLKTIKQIGKSKYSSRKLHTELANLFGDRLLGESRVRLVIPSFNLETGEVYLFKTRHIARYERDHKVPAVDVAMATAAAPTFFPTHNLSDGVPLVDGGVWANNPTGIAVVEAIGVLGWNAEEIRVLSLGCTEEPFNAGHTIKRALGFGYWATKITKTFLAAQSSGSMGVAANLVTHDHIYRFNPSAPARRFGLDKVSAIQSLRGLGASEARKALSSIKPVFFMSAAERFTPEN